MRQKLHRFIPTREHIHQNRWLRWLGPYLTHPRLWHFSRRGVANGVALGVFFGLLIPIAQIPFSAAAAVLLRANVPVAVGSTLVTNPITFAPIYVFAHHLGEQLLGDHAAVAAPAASAAPLTDNAGWWRKAWQSTLGVGRPLLLGLGILAVSAGILTYVSIMFFWRIKTAWTWKRRRRKSGFQP